MSAVLLSIIAFVVLVTAIEAGHAIAHRGMARFSTETRDTVKQATGIVASLTALVLGLLIANGQRSFEQQSAAVSSLVAGISSLDETLRHFGPDATEVRAELRKAVGPVLLSLWGDRQSAGLDERSRTENESFIDGILRLPSTDPEQKILKDGAVKLGDMLVQERFRLATLEHVALPVVLIIVLFGWSCVVFMGLGFCASLDLIGRLALYAAAGAAATAIFLVVEYATAFSGMIQISRRPVEVLAAALSGG